MRYPLQPHRPPPVHYPAPQQYLGTDPEGRPVYGTPATAPVAPLQPIRVHPWGAYIAGGCLAVMALIAVAVAVTAIMIGFSIALAVLALVAVALTICLLVLRSMWREYQRGD